MNFTPGGGEVALDEVRHVRRGLGHSGAEIARTVQVPENRCHVEIPRSCAKTSEAWSYRR